MRSHEIAELAGVTVRTLRHYHALGLLPEPPRHENGYRDYGVQDLVILLRIKRLASLGFSLEQVGAMLSRSEDASEVADELDALDRELVQRIERLQNQRAIIAKLKAQGVRGHVPPDYACFIGAITERTRNAELLALETDTALLAESVLPPEVTAILSAYHAEVMAQGKIDAYVALNERFMALQPTASTLEKESLVRDFVEFATPLIAKALEPVSLSGLWLPDNMVNIMLDFDETTLNHAQRAVSDAIDDAVGRELLRMGCFGEEATKYFAQLLDSDATS